MYNLITPPVYTDLISLDLAKKHLRLDHNSEDDLVAIYLQAAHRLAEAESGTLIGAQTWELSKCDFSYMTAFHKQPVSSVTNVKYYDTENDDQTWDAANYRLIAPTRGVAYLEIDQNAEYPATYNRSDAVRIRFVAGSTDPLTKQIILLACGAFFENRQGEVVGTISSEIALGIKRLAGKLRGY